MVIALILWNATVLFVGLIGHFSSDKLAILFFGAWYGVAFWEGLHVHNWLFPKRK